MGLKINLKKIIINIKCGDISQKERRGFAMEIGIQLYTVNSLLRDLESAKDTIQKLKAMGYGFVQLAGDIEQIEMTAQACKEVGMPAVGMLWDMELYERYTERVFAAARLCGATDLGISSTVSTDEDTKNLLQRANAFAAIARQEGFTFSYHHHSLEFLRCESGKTVMEQLCASLEGDLMADTYWLQHGGADVRDFIERHCEKIKILHLKDMKRTRDGVTFAELGRGTMNMSGIVQTAIACGIKCFVIEQDRCDGDPLESARISIKYAKNLFKENF